MAKAIKIGVFDSGVGGLSVANAIQKALPQHEIIYKEDAEHVPYGTKTIDQIYEFTKPILQELLKEGCQVIVIACNTVTTNLIERLRQELPVPLIGMEPMIKPAAAATSSGVIAVCATPSTLSSDRYKWLKQGYAAGIKVLEPDCSDWSMMIENNNIDHKKIANTVEEVCRAGADQIVLGCTHYHWIEEDIKELAKGRANVIQPVEPVIAQLKTVLERLA
jgi:glutamate racemase